MQLSEFVDRFLVYHLPPSSNTNHDRAVRLSRTVQTSDPLRDVIIALSTWYHAEVPCPPYSKEREVDGPSSCPSMLLLSAGSPPILQQQLQCPHPFSQSISFEPSKARLASFPLSNQSVNNQFSNSISMGSKGAAPKRTSKGAMPVVLRVVMRSAHSAVGRCRCQSDSRRPAIFRQASTNVACPLSIIPFA